MEEGLTLQWDLLNRWRLAVHYRNEMVKVVGLDALKKVPEYWVMEDSYTECELLAVKNGSISQHKAQQFFDSVYTLMEIVDAACIELYWNSNPQI